MGDKIDMSLDDIIKLGGRKRGGGMGRGRGNRGGGRGAGKLTNQSYGIKKKGPLRTAGGAGAASGMRLRSRQTPYARGSRSSDKWEHDMYEDAPESGMRSRGAGQTHLLVSNLEYGVTDADIEELFLEFGSLRKAAIHYDKSGRSLGTADVVYERRTDALKAVSQYNDVPLDGRPMKIQMVAGSAGAGRPMKMQMGSGGGETISRSKVGGGGGRTRGGGLRRGGGRGGGGGRGARGGREPKVAPTAEELDAELDAYVNKMN